jgi:hypothetical protein
MNRAATLRLGFSSIFWIHAWAFTGPSILTLCRSGLKEKFSWLQLSTPKVCVLGGVLPSHCVTSSRNGETLDSAWRLRSSTSYGYCSCGTHNMFRWDPRAGPTSGGTHTFLFVGPTILLRDSWLKIYVFSFGEQKRPILFKIIYSYFIYKLYYSVFSLRFCSVTNYFVL